MTKEKYINYLECAYLSKKKEVECEENISETAMEYLNSVEAFIHILKLCDRDYPFVKSVSTAFVSMINRRITIESDSLVDQIETCNFKKENGKNSIEIAIKSCDLLRLMLLNISIFLNPVEMGELFEEVKAKVREKIESEGEEAVKKQFEKVIEECEETWLEEYGCTIEDIENLESIIGPQPDFDEVMGRIIRVEKY